MDSQILEDWFVQHCRQGQLPAEAVQVWLQQQQMTMSQLLLALLPLAQRFSRPIVSEFSVGAVALGVSGALYIGANQEFSRQPLMLTLHAEQVALIHARSHQELGVQQLAVAQSPCGFCRQFLMELVDSGGMDIILAGGECMTLADLLPQAFSAKTMQIEADFWQQQPHALELIAPSPSSLVTKALNAASCSYAPYTQAYCGAALQLVDGTVITGSTLENAAFNPSISAITAALASLSMQGGDYTQVQQLALCQVENAAVDHQAVTTQLLAEVAPQAKIAVYWVKDAKG